MPSQQDGPGQPSEALSGRSRRPLLLRRDFGLYWASGLLSNVGTWLHNVTASILVFSLTGSTLNVALLNVATFVPVLVFSVSAGTLADRVDRRAVVLVTSVVSLLTALALAVATAVDVVSAATLVAATGVLATAHAFAKPAHSAMLPALVERDEVARATVVNTLQFTGGQVVGSALASLVLVVAGPAWAFGVNAATFLAPVLAMALIRLPSGPGTRRRQRGSAVEGLRHVRSTAGMSAVLGVVVLVNAAPEALRTLAPAIATRSLGEDESRAALLVTAYSLGAVAGLLLGTVLRVLTPVRAVLLAAALQLAGLLGLASAPSLALALAAAAPIGLGFSVAVPVLNAALQTSTPDGLRGRVMAAFSMAHLGLRPVFSLAAGGVAAVAGARGAAAATSAFAVLALLATTRMPQPAAATAPPMEREPG